VLIRAAVPALILFFASPSSAAASQIWFGSTTQSAEWGPDASASVIYPVDSGNPGSAIADFTFIPTLTTSVIGVVLDDGAPLVEVSTFSITFAPISLTVPVQLSPGRSVEFVLNTDAFTVKVPGFAGGSGIGGGALRIAFQSLVVPGTPLHWSLPFGGTVDQAVPRFSGELTLWLDSLDPGSVGNLVLFGQIEPGPGPVAGVDPVTGRPVVAFVENPLIGGRTGLAIPIVAIPEAGTGTLLAIGLALLAWRKETAAQSSGCPCPSRLTS